MQSSSEMHSLVQQIKLRQEEFKKTIMKNPTQLNNFNSLTSPNQRREQTPNQRRAKIESSDNSCSPTLFRTPQISLHYEQKKKQQQQHQRQPSNNRSRNENASTMKEKLVNVDSATKDYSRVLDEVMKVYRQQKEELITKEKEIQKTQFYKDEWLKERKRNEHLVDRNKQLKNKLLKVIELVQQDQLQQHDESEAIIASLQTENTYLRRMLNLYDVLEQPNQLELSEQDQDVDYIDSILNVFLTDLKQISTKRKEKRDNFSQGQFNSLALTVLNKESSFVDLSEDKLLEEQSQIKQS